MKELESQLQNVQNSEEKVKNIENMERRLEEQQRQLEMYKQMIVTSNSLEKERESVTSNKNLRRGTWCPTGNNRSLSRSSLTPVEGIESRLKNTFGFDSNFESKKLDNELLSNNNRIDDSEDDTSEQIDNTSLFEQLQSANEQIDTLKEYSETLQQENSIIEEKLEHMVSKCETLENELVDTKEKLILFADNYEISEQKKSEMVKNVEL